MDTFEYKGKVYDVTWESKDTRHGGPFDRGSADSYYGRGLNPHYYVGATRLSDRVELEDMTQDEIQAYYAGYEYNDTVLRSFKEW